jgi:very-short-patch-repair endonuclease/glutaredoxin
MMSVSEKFHQELTEIVKTMKVGEWKRAYGSGGMSMFVTPCYEECGNPVLSWNRRKQAFRCDYCKAELKKKEKDLSVRVHDVIMEKRIYDARKIVLTKFGTLVDYEEAFLKIEKKKDKPGWFQSKWEVLAAAELLRLKIRAKHQAHVGKFVVDFCLPTLKIALEIDGGFHEYKPVKDRDRMRDAEMIRDLGPGWKIVRIGHKLLKDDIQDLYPKICRTVRRTLRGQTAVK